MAMFKGASPTSAARDRAGELIEGVRRGRKELISPEGVPLDVQIAGHGERLAAFLIDMFFMLAAVLCLAVLLGLFVFSGFPAFPKARPVSYMLGTTLITFTIFVVRNLYFLHFELAWQGRTPGKKICGLRVINREGGELTSSAVVARNLTREVEVFLPLGLFLSLDANSGLAQLAALGWALALTAVPFFNREHLRAGDLIAGTQVIAIPKRALLGDLTELTLTERTFTERTPAEREAEQPGPPATDAPPAEPRKRTYTFTHEQLAIYGNLELQVLEEILRRPGNGNGLLLREVCEKICRKIGWKEPAPSGDARRFLSDFYAAERAELERGQLFGRIREDKAEAGR